MNLTTVLIIAAVVVFLVMPFNGAAFSILFGATIWLLREAHVRRVSKQEFTPLFRALLWAAAVLSGLFSIAAGALSVMVLMDHNPGWGGIVLFFSVPICLVGAATVFVFAWYARYRPSGSPEKRVMSDE